MKTPRSSPTTKGQRVQFRNPAKTATGTVLKVDPKDDFKGWCTVEWDAGSQQMCHVNELRLIEPTK